MSTPTDILLLGDVSRNESRILRRLPKRREIRARHGRATLLAAEELIASRAVRQLTVGTDFVEARIVEQEQEQSAVWQLDDDNTLWWECSCTSPSRCSHLAAIALLARSGELIQDSGDSQSVVARPVEERSTSFPLPPELPSQALLPFGQSSQQESTPVGSPSLQILIELPLTSARQKWCFRLSPSTRASEPLTQPLASMLSDSDQQIVRRLEAAGYTLDEWNQGHLVQALPLIAGHDEIQDLEGNRLRVSTQPRAVEYRLEAAPRPGTSNDPKNPAGWSVRGQVFVERADQPVSAWVVLPGSPGWCFDGSLFSPFDTNDPVGIAALAPDGCLRLEEPRHIVRLLESAHLTWSGPPLELRHRTADAIAELDLLDDRLLLRAALRDLGGGLWPVQADGCYRPFAYGFEYCSVELMESTLKRIAAAGFETLAEPGDYQIAGTPQLDLFLELHLPRWQQAGIQISCSPALREVLEGRLEVVSKIQINQRDQIDWFEICWQLEAGGEIIPADEIQAVRLFRGRFYRLKDGRVVSINRTRLKRQIDELMTMGCSPFNSSPQRLPIQFLPRVLDLAASDDHQPRRHEISLPSSLDAIRRSLLQRDYVPSGTLPPHLSNTLREYQLDGFRFLEFLFQHRLGGLLADDMGLGKTLQTLALLAFLQVQQGKQPNLVICPTSVAPNWIEEASRFTPELKSIRLSTSRELKNCRWSDYDLIVTSYGLAQRNSIPTAFRCLVLDEAQNIKNPRARRSQAVKKLKADVRLALSGTPIENSVVELWSLFDFLMPGFLGNLTLFQQLYVRPIMKLGDSSRTAALARHVQPFILRRLKSDVARELPPKVEQNIYCDLNLRQKKVYRQLVAAVRRDVREQIATHGWEASQISVLAALMRLRQLCCHAGLIDPALMSIPSGKMEAFLEVVETILAGGHRVVVFSQFVKMLRLLETAFQPRRWRYLYLDGSTRNRQQLVRQFQDEGQHSIFLMSLKAGGTGLTLTAADYVILFDPWWNPSVENQAIDRIHRIGQERRVTAYRMVSRGTIEEKMMRLKERKRELADNVLVGSDSISQLTPDDIDELLS